MGERNGNVKRENLINEIKEKVEILKGCYLTKRVQRQILDGDKFLQKLNEPKYLSCKNVSEIKNNLCWEREALKKQKNELEFELPNYQFSLEDYVQGIPKNQRTAEEEKLIEDTKKMLDDEIHWLHKCLGMVKNTEYFN